METKADLFGLSGPADLMRCVAENYEELVKDPSARNLMNCLMLVNHLPDWVWHAWLQDHPDRQQAIGVPSSVTAAPTKKRRGVFMTDWVEKNCPDAKIIRALANGAKHFEGRPDTQSGYMATVLIPFTELAYFVDVNSDSRACIFWRGASGGTVLCNVIDFWKRFVEQHAGWSS